MKVIKKDGAEEPFDAQKIWTAIQKSANRAMVTLTQENCQRVSDLVLEMIEGETEVPISKMHLCVEKALEQVSPETAKSYKDYRNYKQDFIHILDKVYQKAQSIRYIGDRDNANTDSALVSTQRSLIYNELNSELYKKFFLNAEENEAMKDGYIYIHDRSARLDTMNCFRRDTRFITKDGVRSFYDFADGDETIVMTHLGRWRRATVHKYGYQPIQCVTFKQKTGTSKGRDIYCTANHRWILQDGSETTNLQTGDALWQVPDVTIFDWDDLSLPNKRLWCMGFALGDGNIYTENTGYGTHQSVVVRLCGAKQKYATRFQDAGYTVTTPPSAKGDAQVYMPYFGVNKIPFMELTYANILYFVNGLMCADGHHAPSPQSSSEFRGIQASGSVNDYLYDWLNMSRYFVTRVTDLTGQETNYGTRQQQTFSYACSSSQQNTAGWMVADIQPATLNSKSEVWCLEVDEDHSFILEGGIPTGNCCLADMTAILTGGFEMGNVWYNEPKTLDVAFDVISDVTISMAAMQYGK